MKKVLSLVLLLAVAASLSSCGVVYGAWGSAHHARGGWYDATKTAPVKRIPTTPWLPR